MASIRGFTGLGVRGLLVDVVDATSVVDVVGVVEEAFVVSMVVVVSAETQ